MRLPRWGRCDKLSFQEVQEIVGRLFKVPLKAILHRSRKTKVSEARAVLCYIMVRKIGIQGTEVGKFLSIGSSSVSRAIQRGERIVQDHPQISKSIDIKLKQ